MPRVNPNRSLINERNLARRIQHERHKSGMSTDGLAKRMTNLGVPMQKTTVFKIENGDRRITIDELVVFAAVFGVDVTDMLTPVEVVLDNESGAVVKELCTELDEVRYHACKVIAAVGRWNDLRTALDHEGLDEAMQRIRKEPDALRSDYPVALPADCIAPYRRFVASLWKSSDEAAN